MRYRGNPENFDSSLEHLRQMILMGDVSAVADYLVALQNITGKDVTQWHSHYLKVLRSLYSEDGISYLEMVNVVDLTRMLYGQKAADILNLHLQGNNKFFLDNNSFHHFVSS